MQFDRARATTGLTAATCALALVFGVAVFVAPHPAAAAATLYECLDPWHAVCQTCGPNQVCAMIWTDLGSCCTTQGQAVCVTSCIEPIDSPCFDKPGCRS